MNRGICIGIVLGAAVAGVSTGLSQTAGTSPATQAVVHPVPPPVISPQSSPLTTVDDFLKWDADSKKITVTNGTSQSHFAFNLTNVSPGVVTILAANGSCFCTVAKLPEQPWKIPAGGTGEINVTMDLAGKSGTVPKTIAVATDKGAKMLYVSTTILPPAAPTQMNPAQRESNQKLAIADRQAVFKGECARCHAEPAKNKMGQALFESLCGVCHEAERRATMVPNLHAITQETGPEFWRNWISHGKPGSLMPAFSEAEGGILSDAQITSLVRYLITAIPSKPAVAAPKTTATAN